MLLGAISALTHKFATSALITLHTHINILVDSLDSPHICIYVYVRTGKVDLQVFWRIMWHLNNCLSRIHISIHYNFILIFIAVCLLVKTGRKCAITAARQSDFDGISMRLVERGNI